MDRVNNIIGNNVNQNNIDNLIMFLLNRQVNNNVNNLEIIHKSLQDLGYYNIIRVNEEEKHINNYLVNMFKEFITSMNNELFNVNEVRNTYYRSAEYENFQRQLNFRLDRFNTLSQSHNLADFYRRCTLSELIILANIN
jgi:hypothetical protein